MATPIDPSLDVQQQIRLRAGANSSGGRGPEDPVGSPDRPQLTTPPVPGFATRPPAYGPTTGPVGNPRGTSPINQPVTNTPPPANGPAPGTYTPPGAPVAPPPPAAGPAGLNSAAPQISSAQSGDKGLEDKFFQFLSANGYTTGASNRGAGFFAGGGQYRGNLGDLVNQFNQQTGMNARTVAGRDDQIDFGGGARDVLTAGANDWWLSPQSGPSSVTGNGPAAGGAQAPAAPVQTGPAPGSFQASLRQMLLERMGALSKPFDPNDPSIEEPMGAARLEASRAQEMERKALAERRAANGDTSAGLEQAIQQSAERNAVGLGGIKAELIGRQLTARRAELQNLMGMAMQSGDAESARALQMQMAQMDDQLRRLGLSEQGRQFDASLGQRKSEFDDNFGWDVSQGLYGRDRDLALYGSGGN